MGSAVGSEYQSTGETGVQLVKSNLFTTFPTYHSTMPLCRSCSPAPRLQLGRGHSLGLIRIEFTRIDIVSLAPGTAFVAQFVLDTGLLSESDRI